VSLGRAMWRWLWSSSFVTRVARSKTAGGLGGGGVSATTSPRLCLKTGLGDSGRSDSGRVCRFSGRKPNVLTPTVAMPAGVVTLLGRRCGYLSREGSG
jgi:hypothetical protein